MTAILLFHQLSVNYVSKKIWTVSVDYEFALKAQHL